MYKSLPFAWILAFLSAPGIAAASAPQGFDNWRVARIRVETQTDLATLLELDRASAEFEPSVPPFGTGTFEVRMSPGQFQELQGSGLAYEVTIADLQAWYDSAFATGATAAVTNDEFFENYRTYEEHIALMDTLVATYPGLAERISLGKSSYGRDLWALHITGPDNAADLPPGERPAVLFHGAQHGNEIMAAAAMAYFANHLLTNYDTDPDVADLVDNIDWYICDIMNPDGYVLGMRHNGHGVDLNRNWGGPGAGQGSLPGPYPFSEPETAAVRDFLIQHPNVQAYTDFHTYGFWIMWAWSHKPDLCEDEPTYQMLGHEIAARIHAVHGVTYTPGPGYGTLYPVSGGSTDYVYGVLRRWPLLVEIGYSHYMDPEDIVPICAELVPGMLYYAEWLSDCNGNTVYDAIDIDLGTSDDCNGNHVPDECEPQPDFDLDGLFDVCDDDTDNDGVPDELDVCDRTPAGMPIQASGAPLGDSNGDCLPDLLDFNRLCRCSRDAGPARPLDPESDCARLYDFNGDDRLDLLDFAAFQNIFLPNAGFGVCAPGNGSCFTPGWGPGCDGVDCCLRVCETEPACCETAWSDACAQLARTICPY